MEGISISNTPQFSRTQIELLNKDGIVTLMDFLTSSKESICSCVQISEEEYDKVRKNMLVYAQPQPVALTQIDSYVKSSPRPTGVTSLDDVLGGGLYGGEVIECYGKTGTGKTQLCHIISSKFCNCAQMDAGVMYFDMKNDFSAERLFQLCGNVEQSLENVRIFREPNLNALMSRLDDIKNQVIGGINSFYARTRLLIIDSVPVAIYPAIEEESYSWRIHLERLMNALKWLADRLDLTVILVNHAVSIRAKGGSGSYRFTNRNTQVKAALGQYWQSRVATRIQLSKSLVSKNRFVGVFEKCNRMAVGKKFEFSTYL